MITKVTWDGGDVPAGEATAFQFLGSADSSETYTFGVRQTYSDGSVVDWNGAGELRHARADGRGDELARRQRRLVDAGDRRAGRRRARARPRRGGARRRHAGGARWRETLVRRRPRRGRRSARAAGRGVGARRAACARIPSAERDGEHAAEGVRLTYSEAVEPRFAIVSVTDADAASRPPAPPRRSPGERRHARRPAEEAAEGWYLV